jgi:peptide/nickel transport system substrate-binding protein
VGLGYQTSLATAVALIAAIAPASAADTPKRGGTLTYSIPADSPPSFDGHREQTYATIHAVSPYYSVLIRVNPGNPASTTDFVCDLCTDMPKPTDDSKTYTFKIRDGVKFHDGSPLTAADVAASWNEIVFPPQGVMSARKSFYEMVDKIEAPDPTTVVFRLKFATGAFIPALADPFAYIYSKAQLDKDPHWYEHNIMGSGPFKFVSYEAGQSIKGVRNPDYYHKGKPYLDAIEGIFAPKQATRVDAIRSDRAAIEFRGLPPAARDELKQALGDEITVQESVWNCGSDLFFNHKQKPFDDVRVRRALSLAIDRWGGAPALSKIAIVKAVGGIVFPTSPLAMSKEELHQQVAGGGQAAPQGGRRRKPDFRAVKPRRRPALQICRHLANRPVGQDRRPRDAAGGAERAVVPGHANGQFRGRALPDLPQHREPAVGRAALSADLDQLRELRLLRGPAGGRPLQQDAA